MENANGEWIVRSARSARLGVAMVGSMMLWAATCTAADDAVNLESVVILALGALDGRAVVRASDNSMHVLKLGSVIPGTNATVTQILADKLVVEDADVVDSAGHSQIVWLTKSGPDGKVTVQRLQSDAPPPTIVGPTTGVTATPIDKTNKDSKKKRN